MIRHNSIYVGLISRGEENERTDSPKSVKAIRSFSRASAVCVFHPAIPRRTLPSVARSASPDEVVKTIPFPISGAKVLLLSDMCKFNSHKMQKYVVQHKKEGEISPPFLSTMRLRRISLSSQRN